MTSSWEFQRLWHLSMPGEFHRCSQVLSSTQSLSQSGVCSGYDTHLRAYLGVHGPVEHFSVTDPDDGRCRFGVVSMTGQIERVPGPEAHHRPSANDWVLRGNWKEERGYTFSRLQWDLCGMSHHIQSGWSQALLLFACTCSSSLTVFKCGEHKRGRSVEIFWGFLSFFFAAFDVSCIWLCFSAFDLGLFFMCHSPSRNLFNQEKWHWNISWRLSFTFTLTPSDSLKCVYELNNYIQGKELTAHRHEFGCICIHQAWLSKQHWLLL